MTYFTEDWLTDEEVRKELIAAEEAREEAEEQRRLEEQKQDA